MLQMEPLFVCFYIREGLPYGIRAVDCLVLERKVMLMEIFTWTRNYILSIPLRALKGVECHLTVDP